MKRFLLGLVVVFALASCQKEVGFDTPTGGGGTGGGGTGGGGSTASDSYQPMTKDSWWKYKDTGVVNQTMTITATGQKKTIGSKVYDVANFTGTVQGTAEGYFYVAKPVYGVRQDVNNGTISTIELIYLNDTASVGYKWTDNMPPVNGFPARFNGEIKERNITKTVNGKTYTNVIHTQTRLEYEFPVLGWTEFAVYDYYVAKGIGMIKIETEIIAFGVSGGKGVRDLIDYSIK